MGRPPEATGEIALDPCGSAVVPELSKCLLEQVGSADLEVQRLELAQSKELLVGEIPRLFQPHIATANHRLLVRCSLLAYLIAADLLDGGHEMANDMELVEHQHCARRSLLDGIDVRLPHVAENLFEVGNSFRTKEIEERPKVASLRPSPLHTSRLAIRS